jgi:radical SAM protein with 4Fe4S-binding SPASM domain
MKLVSFFPNAAIKTLAIRTHNLIFHQGWNMPEMISLELSQACNRHCVYCPQDLAPKKQQIASQEVWKTFLNRLEEIHWRGIVAFHFFNEPTLVPKFPEYVRELKQRIPKCMPYLFTNGDRPAVIEEALQAGIFVATITQHPPYKEGWSEPIDALKKKWGMHVRVQRILPVAEAGKKQDGFNGEVIEMHNQAGRIDVEWEPFEKCIHESGAMWIDYQGNMLMCCRDYEHEYKFGNIMDRGIKDIWYSPKAVKVRQLVNKGISATKLCDGCFEGNSKNPKKPATEAVAAT